MGLAETQRVLARLYTEAGFRDRFFADPAGGRGALGLGSDEAERLARLPAEQVYLFARSLRRKRLGAVASLLALTRRALSARFGFFFAQYADAHPAAGTRTPRADATAFAAFLARVTRDRRIEPAWVGDLARYEAAFLAVADPRRRWVIRWFAHPVGRLVRGLVAGAGAPSPPRRPTVGLWCRLARRGRIWHLTLSLPPWPERRDGCRG